MNDLLYGIGDLDEETIFWNEEEEKSGVESVMQIVRHNHGHITCFNHV